MAQGSVRPQGKIQVRVAQNVKSVSSWDVTSRSLAYGYWRVAETCSLGILTPVNTAVNMRIPRKKKIFVTFERLSHSQEGLGPWNGLKKD
jgi:hypothetical protein